MGSRKRDRATARGSLPARYPGTVGRTGHERATVFVNVTTKLSAVPRLTRHSLKFHREIAPQARRVTGVGESGKGGFSHFIHCACPTFDNARLARRHESDPRRPLFLSLSLFLIKKSEL